MKQSRHHLAEVIAEKTLHVTDTKKLSQEIAAYLLYENQDTDLQSLMRDVIQYRADRGIIEAVISSAHPVSDLVKDDVRKMLKDEYPSAKSIIVREEHDESVIGGLRIDLANEQLDLTIKSKLSTFKRLTATERNR